MPSVWL